MKRSVFVFLRSRGELCCKNPAIMGIPSQEEIFFCKFFLLGNKCALPLFFIFPLSPLSLLRRRRRRGMRGKLEMTAHFGTLSLFGTEKRRFFWRERERISSAHAYMSNSNKNILCSMTCGWVLKREQQGRRGYHNTNSK